MARHRIDWVEARRLYEFEGKNYTEIAELVGCDPQAVGIHARTESWVNHATIVRDSGPDRIRTIIDEFIEQDREAIKANLAAKHSINQRILALTRRHIERLENDQLFAIQTGTKRDGTPIVVEEDPVVSLSRLALTAQRVEAMDRSIADLKDGTWRAKEDKPAEVSTESMTPKQIEQLLSAMDKPQDEAEVN